MAVITAKAIDISLMKTTTRIAKRSNNLKAKCARIFAFLLLFCFLGVLNLNAQSTKEFKTSTDTLVVYSDVPGVAPSDKYTIRVRSAATNNQWVDVFANFTYNKAVPGSTDLNSPDKYQVNCAAWSHAYGNIEMNNGQAVEVEIAAKPGFKIGGKDFEKAKVHPAQKASAATIVGGKVYFTITKPGQIYIDINGQMDDYNRAINPIGHPVHVVTLFANPVINKPTLTGTRVRTIEPGTNLATINAINPSTYDTMYFKPGLHDIASGIKMHPGKTIYIPGDAYIYGSFNNGGVQAGSYSSNGEKITIYGYGTICGAKIPHYQVSPDLLPVLYPGVVVDGDKAIEIENPLNCKISGVTLADNANHSIEINGSNNSINWLKTISWRVNGDGLGGYTDAEDCFIRAHDDCSYVKANKKRCTFWKDSNARLFYMATIPTDRQIIIEDCDVLYARLRSNPGGNGGGFNSGGGGKVNVIFRNIRFHDKLINMRVFNLYSDESSGFLSGVLFQNISIAGMAPGNKQQLTGSATSIWDGGLIIDNLTIGGALITNENYKTYFNTNEYVKNIWFRMPDYYKITKNVNPIQGTVSVTPTDQSRFAIKIDTDTTYLENSPVILRATAIPGYEFTGWSGDTISTTNPISIVMNGNKSITANFVNVGMKTLTITTPVNGTVISTPEGTTYSYNSRVKLLVKPAIGYKFNGWSGDFTSTSIVDSITMNSDKTITANFLKTNNFAVNFGGDQYIAADGTLYAQTPKGFTKIVAISGTDDDFLYQCESSPSSLNYPVDNGDYTVTLKFTEIFLAASGIGKRVFDVIIEGDTVLNRFDIFAEAGGSAKALDKTFNTTVSDSILNIIFTPGRKINAIKITNNAETSVIQPSLNHSISIYPNPATDKLFFNSADKQISKIQIVDLTGKIVHSVNVQMQNGSVDLTGIAPGLYLVKIVLENNIVTKKISIK